MEAPASSVTYSPAIDGGAVMEKEGLLSQVDPFLVEALENPRHRLTVLRMELDILRFMQNSDLYQYEFQQLPTSYLRCAAHRVAQHYGLQTMALDNIVDGLGSRIIATKTPDSRFPVVCLSEVPAKQSEKEIGEQVKIAIRPRPGKTPATDVFELGTRRSPVKTVEERKEQYDKARARIFSGSSSPDVEGSPSTLSSNGRSMSASGDELESDRTVEENDITGAKDGASRVAILRDREKERSDPDYDRSYDRYQRYVRGLVTPSQNFVLQSCNVVQPPFLQYEAGFSRMGQVPMRNPTPVSYRVPGPTMNPFGAFGSNPSSEDAVFMQWPSSHAMVYGPSYDHFRHAVIQVPFYQQPVRFEHSQNC